jgi:hypothetical protein
MQREEGESRSCWPPGFQGLCLVRWHALTMDLKRSRRSFCFSGL